MRYAMIMAGGAGTRLWPMSRKNTPKQILRFIKRDSDKQPHALLEIADQRLEGLVETKRRWVCTAEQYRDAVQKILPKYADERILGEPAARDTVNAVGFAAAIIAKEDEDAVFAVLTADHVIEPVKDFQERMDLGFRLVERDDRRFVTFSIKPTYPATGYGYVERGMPIRDAKDGKLAAVEGSKDHAYHVVRFVEKPDKARAEVYLESGDYGWNSGMFVWKAATFLEALERFVPESYAGLMEIQKAWGTRKYKGVLEAVYPTLPKTSVDYAIMEPATKTSVGGGGASGGKATADAKGDAKGDAKANAKSDARADSKAQKKNQEAFRVCTVQMDLMWLDVGSWPAFAETVKPDKRGNKATGEGTVALHDCEGSLVIAGKGHTVAVLGMSDVIVVHTADATLVMPKGRAEDLKQLHGMIEEGLR